MKSCLGTVHYYTDTVLHCSSGIRTRDLRIANILLHGSDNNNVDNRELFSVVQKFIATIYVETVNDIDLCV
jgi:hypothetical protein